MTADDGIERGDDAAASPAAAAAAELIATPESEAGCGREDAIVDWPRSSVTDDGATWTTPQQCSSAHNKRRPCKCVLWKMCSA